MIQSKTKSFPPVTDDRNVTNQGQQAFIDNQIRVEQNGTFSKITEDEQRSNSTGNVVTRLEQFEIKPKNPQSIDSKSSNSGSANKFYYRNPQSIDSDSSNPPLENGSQISALQQENEQNADFDTARLRTVEGAFDINAEDRAKTYHMLGKLSEALECYKGGEGKDGEAKYSGWNKVLDYGIASKVIFFLAVTSFAGPLIHSFDNAFNFSNFTNESGGEMLVSFLLLTALAGMVMIVENYAKESDKEVVQNLKAQLQCTMGDFMNGKKVDIKELDNIVKKITSLCPNGKGLLAEYDQLKQHITRVDVKDAIMAGVPNKANKSLVKQGSKLEQKAIRVTAKEDVMKLDKMIKISNALKTIPTVVNNRLEPNMHMIGAKA